MGRTAKPFRGFGLGVMRRLRGAPPDDLQLVIRECTRLVQGGVFFDIGANVGLVSEALAPHASKVVAVEPDPDTFEKLKARMGARATCVQALIGADGSERVFLRNTISSGSSTSVAPGEIPPGHGELVPSPMNAISLDRLAEEHGAPRLIKVDVEGSELGVLESGPNVLRTARPVVVMEFNALCLAQFGRINPRDAIERILQMFPKVEAIMPDGLKRVTDPYMFLSENILERRAMDNLVCSWG